MGRAARSKTPPRGSSAHKGGYFLKSSLEPTLLGRIVLTFLVLGCLFAFLLRSNPVIFVTCSLLATVLLSIPLNAIAGS
ncbi:MAG: hypothetical protein OER88_04940, partial [Planctomycetota bacterium]|nr:hypothetical protein [Planctomycetota bacterium]